MSAFDWLNVKPGIEQTALVGEIRDQSHLYGVLDLMRELGLDLASVDRTGGRQVRRWGEREIKGTVRALQP